MVTTNDNQQNPFLTVVEFYNYIAKHEDEIYNPEIESLRDEIKLATATDEIIDIVHRITGTRIDKAEFEKIIREQKQKSCAWETYESMVRQGNPDDSFHGLSYILTNEDKIYDFRSYLNPELDFIKSDATE